MKVRIVQPYYDEASRAKVSAPAVPHHNPVCTEYFNARIVIDVVRAGGHRPSEWFGLLSPVAFDKLRSLGNSHTSCATLVDRVAADGPSPFDYYYPHFGCGHPWRQGAGCHGEKFVACARGVLSALGVRGDPLELPCPPVYCDYEIARTDLYEDFVRNCLAPAVCVMSEARGELRALLWSDAKYTEGKVTPERALALWGVPFYTMHAFVAERLFPTYAALKGWRGCALA